VKERDFDKKKEKNISQREKKKGSFLLGCDSFVIKIFATLVLSKLLGIFVRVLGVFVRECCVCAFLGYV